MYASVSALGQGEDNKKMLNTSSMQMLIVPIILFSLESVIVLVLMGDKR
jgi:hypothetical protein